MHELLKNLLCAAGISGYESEIASVMTGELKKTCDEVRTDSFGSVIAKKGAGKKKIMIAAHMDEIGLLVKHVTKEGFLSFVKVGGVDDRILLGQRVVVKGHGGDVPGIIGARPPHILKDDERKQPPKHEDMYIDIGARDKQDAERRIAIADPVVFEPNFGAFGNGLFYGKAVDDRIGCYCLLKVMEKLSVDAEVFAVATAQEEVGLKGARTASFGIDPDFAIAIDTTLAGDTPLMKERESSLKLGAGVAITTVEAGGRGFILNAKIKETLMDIARKNNIPFQMDVLEGGMTDGAMIYMNRRGTPTVVLSVPTRYVHSPSSVFCLADADALVTLAVKTIEHFSHHE